MSCMFYNCSSLNEINLSNFNNENVIYMNDMFYNYRKLKEVNLSKFKVDKISKCKFII